MNLEKDEVASNQVYTKVSSTDDTCYLLYRKTWVTTLGLDNKYAGISKYRESIYLGMHMGAVLRDVRIATSAYSYTILEGSEKEFVSIYRYLRSVLWQLSTRELTHFLSKVSVVLSSTFSLRELDSPVAEMVCFSGSAFSHFSFHIFRITGINMGMGGGVKASFGFCMSDKFVLGSCIFDNISKRL